jgi:hypothetical protein
MKSYAQGSLPARTGLAYNPPFKLEMGEMEEGRWKREATA